MNRENFLFIAYYFPPDVSSGSFRPYHFANQLVKLNWNVHILTIKETDYLPGQTRDENLLKNLDNRIKTLRTSIFRPLEFLLTVRKKIFYSKNNSTNYKTQINNAANNHYSPKKKIKDFFTDLITIPDENIGWLPFACYHGYKCIKRNNISVICATGSPWTSMIIGTLLKFFTRRPLVLDFRDPWVSNAGFIAKNRFRQKVEKKLEKYIIKSSNIIIANTQESQKNFLARYRFLSENRVKCIPNGFDKFLNNKPIQTVNNQLTFTHTGTLYFTRNPEYLLTALHDLINKKIIAQNEIKFVFLGEFGFYNGTIRDLLDANELKNVVELKPRCSYEEAVRFQISSHILFLIQPDFPLQIPRKIFDYMAVRKPILAITDKQGATANIIKKHGLGIVAENNINSIKSAILYYYRNWKNKKLVTTPDYDCDDFLIANLSGEFHKILRSLTTNE